MTGVSFLSMMSTLFPFGLGAWGLGLLLLFTAFLIHASFSISSGFYVRAFCRRHTKEKLIALTFDDGPHPAYTPQVLDVLKQYGVKAAFFVIGERIAGNENILERTCMEGHLIGNHSFTHKNTFPLFGRAKMVFDLCLCDSTIARTVAPCSGWFRPPFGVINPNVAKAVKMLKYQVAGWSIRSLDTVKSDKDRVVKRVVSRLHPGAVILLHDPLPDAPYILEQVIRQAVGKGYRFARIDELEASDV
ncbi:MAG: polysaccharide deacetylase family protein [Bacteroidales bacterium]|jgi:peptidoglycan/xylan/chitin deacetylase (PgdA/CDA1 family)|nr:polysaccharide deacetylase family protein [Bacteroidales bacterium]